jgi:3-phosphoshikimate 1-carboxyvinyltransferase
VITGAEELRVKESDRIAAMGAGFAALGVNHTVTPDGMRIRGRREGPVFGAGEVDSRGDHRIAMAFAVASLRASGPISVRDTANVATSFPGFTELARSAGLDVMESESGR